MRVIIFCLSLLFAIALPASAHNQSDLSSSRFAITQHDTFSFQHSPQQNNLSLAISFIDIDEDDLPDSERKIFQVAKKGHYITENLAYSFAKQNTLIINSKSYFYRLHPSLFLFIGSFRL